MTDYKPGTVAKVHDPAYGDMTAILVRDFGSLCWHGMTTDREQFRCVRADEVTDVHPLVVLDLAAAGFSPDGLIGYLRRDAMPGSPRDAIADQIARQTKPPKPPEPTGLGAVVELDPGIYEWARAVHTSNGRWDFSDSSGNGGATRWEYLNVTRVISEGVAL